MSSYYLIGIEDIIETKYMRTSFVEIMFPDLIYLFEQKNFLKNQENNLKNKLKLIKCELEIKAKLNKYNIPEKLLFEINGHTICSREHLKNYTQIFEVISSIPVEFETEKLRKYNIPENQAKLYLKTLLRNQKEKITDSMDKYDTEKFFVRAKEYKRVVI